jgi:hypothetical protein
MLTYADLHNPAITQFGAFLSCPDCGGQYSADRADYFMEMDDDPLICGYCETPLVLARLVIEVLEK